MPAFFEDAAVGETHALGERTVTREEILAFAERYDPQPIHADPEAAAESPFGGLIASGWHTAAVCMRLLVEGRLGDLAVVAARGVDELRWPAPVRPGDTLSVRTAVRDKRPADDPDRGQVDIAVEGRREDGTVVLSYVALVLVERRTPR